jgi:RNA polymerase sigma-70 factor, ECF subfamily
MSAAPRPTLRPLALASTPEASVPPDAWDQESAVFELGSVPPPRRVVAECDALASDEAGEPAGDVGELFNAYRAYVAKIGRRILGSSHELDDLIQDVFLATVRDIHKLQDPARLAAWLGTITTRMAKRRRYRNSLFPLPCSDDSEQVLERPSEDAPSPESTADLSSHVQRVMSMPDELKMPWLLKHVEGLTLEAVAEQCDCSLSTVQRRIQTVNGRIHKPRG